MPGVGRSWRKAVTGLSPAPPWSPSELCVELTTGAGHLPSSPPAVLVDQRTKDERRPWQTAFDPGARRVEFPGLGWGQRVGTLACSVWVVSIQVGHWCRTPGVGTVLTGVGRSRAEAHVPYVQGLLL